MNYKTRTYLNEAVIMRSTGCDMDEVWSMYAKMKFCRLTRRRVICPMPCGDRLPAFGLSLGPPSGMGIG
jgi:hypothetical protein